MEHQPSTVGGGPRRPAITLVTHNLMSLVGKGEEGVMGGGGFIDKAVRRTV